MIGIGFMQKNVRNPSSQHPKWKPEPLQKFGSCTMTSHNVGYKIRFDHYEWYRWLSLKEKRVASRLKDDNPDYFAPPSVENDGKAFHLHQRNLKLMAAQK